jgi:prepilin-type N-terminal cleavage/methylation domain-containing protein
MVTPPVIGRGHGGAPLSNGISSNIPYPPKPTSLTNNLTCQGFTLVELLITVAIILTIAAIAVPRYLLALEQAKIARAVGDIRTIGTAVQVTRL